MIDRGADVEMTSDSRHNHGTVETQSSEENGTPPKTVGERKIQFVGWSGLSRQEKYDLVGWILFIMSSLFYLVAAIEWESLTSILGSLFFLVACFAFVIPMLWKEKQP